MSKGLNLLLFATLMILSGCAGEKVTPSQAQLEAAGHNRRGVDAAAKDEQRALAEFAAARRISTSVEDFDGAALALINSARVARFANRSTQARLFLDDAFPLVGPESPLYGEFSFEKAKLALSTGNLPQAKVWAERAVSAEKGDLLKGRLNLLARIAFLGDRYPDAESAAQKALEMAGEPEESANSSRILGDVYLATGRAALARTLYLQALAADQRLGKSTKIVADLAGLARVAHMAKEPQEELGYRRRAAQVQLAIGNRRQAALQMKEIAALLESMGKKEEGLRALNQGEALLKAPPEEDAPLKEGE